ncbi:hypothetical protein LWL40_27630 (plasmid) [Bacillus thuringiensis]|uniref:hypothetical protein n=1 Tax=Bacillus thuringiensis TaxID=1428 RepID=UPI003D759B10
MKMKSYDVKTEITGTILLEVTPQELANLTASVGMVNVERLAESTRVKESHLLNSYQHGQLWDKLRASYKTVFGGNQ